MNPDDLIIDLDTIVSLYEKSGINIDFLKNERCWGAAKEAEDEFKLAVKTAVKKAYKDGYDGIDLFKDAGCWGVAKEAEDGLKLAAKTVAKEAYKDGYDEDHPDSNYYKGESPPELHLRLDKANEQIEKLKAKIAANAKADKRARDADKKLKAAYVRVNKSMKTLEDLIKKYGEVEKGITNLVASIAADTSEVENLFEEEDLMS